MVQYLPSGKPTRYSILPVATVGTSTALIPIIRVGRCQVGNLGYSRTRVQLASYYETNGAIIMLLSSTKSWQRPEMVSERKEYPGKASAYLHNNSCNCRVQYVIPEAF